MFASYTYDGGGTWTSAVKIVGTDGSDGADGSDASVTALNIFNALTDNGTKEGVFGMQSGEVVLNASYIRSGVLEVLDNNNNVLFKADKSAEEVEISVNALKLTTFGDESYVDFTHGIHTPLVYSSEGKNFQLWVHDDISIYSPYGALNLYGGQGIFSQSDISLAVGTRLWLPGLSNHVASIISDHESRISALEGGCDTCQSQCENCEECDDCDYCDVCDTCDACLFCDTCQSQCENCEECDDCDYCDDCDACDTCDTCLYCDYCDYCEGCEECDDCDYCDDCDDCQSQCEICQECDICDDCDVCEEYEF